MSVSNVNQYFRNKHSSGSGSGPNINGCRVWYPINIDYLQKMAVKKKIPCTVDTASSQQIFHKI